MSGRYVGQVTRTSSARTRIAIFTKKAKRKNKKNTTQVNEHDGERQNISAANAGDKVVWKRKERDEKSAEDDDNGVESK